MSMPTLDTYIPVFSTSQLKSDRCKFKIRGVPMYGRSTWTSNGESTVKTRVLIPILDFSDNAVKLLSCPEIVAAMILQHASKGDSTLGYWKEIIRQQVLIKPKMLSMKKKLALWKTGEKLHTKFYVEEVNDKTR